MKKIDLEKATIKTGKINTPKYKVTIEELVSEFELAKSAIEEAEGLKQSAMHAILQKLSELGVTGTKTKNGYLVSKVKGVSLTGVQMGLARELGATQTKETLNLPKLRQIYTKLGKLEGANEFEYIKIKEAK